MDDFALYRPIDDEGLAAGCYGASVLALIKMQKYPSWALFCYKELVATADRDYEPTVPAFLSEDAILLHPSRQANGFSGLLIAKESAGGRSVVFESTTGEIYMLDVPEIDTKFVAIEDVTLLKS